MGTPYFGRGATIGLATEDTWGTAKARTNWMRLVSSSLDRAIELGDRPHLGTLSAASAVRRDEYTRADNAGGDVEIELAYDDSTLLLLYHAMGACDEAGTSDPYTHTFTLAEALAVGLTVEEIRGNGTALVLEGGLVDQMVLSGSVGEVCRGRFSTIFETAADRAEAGTPTYSSNGNPVLHSHAPATPCAFNSVDYDVLSWELTLARSLTRRQLYGSTLTAKPIRGGFEDVRMRVTREWDADTLHAALTARTSSDLVLSHTDGTREFDITLHNARVYSVSSPINSAGVITETVEFRAFADATDSGVEIAVKNSNALYSAN